LYDAAYADAVRDGQLFERTGGQGDGAPITGLGAPESAVPGCATGFARLAGDGGPRLSR
jgi:hypothetical protein